MMTSSSVMTDATSFRARPVAPTISFKIVAFDIFSETAVTFLTGALAGALAAGALAGAAFLAAGLAAAFAAGVLAAVARAAGFLAAGAFLAGAFVPVVLVAAMQLSLSY